ncbi:MAG: hypothetical protein KA419_18845 [Acidobacteria bacterium]|nr:hypothetical protein [Acidobacteriota bacterium]
MFRKKRPQASGPGPSAEAARIRDLLESAALPGDEAPPFAPWVLSRIRDGIARRQARPDDDPAFHPAGAFALRLLPATFALAFALTAWAGLEMWTGAGASPTRGPSRQTLRTVEEQIISDVLFGLPPQAPAQGGK